MALLLDQGEPKDKTKKENRKCGPKIRKESLRLEKYYEYIPLYTM